MENIHEFKLIRSLILIKNNETSNNDLNYFSFEGFFIACLFIQTTFH